MIGIKKLAGMACLGLIGAIFAGMAYFETNFPKVGPAPQLKVEITPARLERGKYLANHVANCMDCHSQRDFSRYSGPVVPGTEGKGGMRFDSLVGIPGEIYGTNLTPATLGDWTDGELYRAITAGVNKEGRALFPMMPYPAFAQMAEEDIYSIIAYIRTLPPVPNEVPKPRLEFPLNMIVRTIPAEAHPARQLPNRADGVAYGRYLVTSAACMDCHTPMKQGAPIQGMEFAGGTPFTFPNGMTVHSANITPDSETGIGRWTREQFIARFKKAETRPVTGSEPNTVMPWTLFAGMTEEDLGSIYDYLRTLKPIRHSPNKN